MSGLQGTDTVTGIAEVYSDTNAGSSKTLSVTTYTVNDNNGGNNYNVTTLSTATGACARRVLKRSNSFLHALARNSPGFLS